MTVIHCTVFVFYLKLRYNSFMENLRENFLKVYANIPLGLRDDIVLVIDDKPLTWNVAYLEVKEDTDFSKKILKELKDLKLI